MMFICLGDSTIKGDCLGPYIGSLITKKYNNVEVIGTLSEPIGYNKISIIEKYINNANKNVIVIDSALGNRENIGKFIIQHNKSQVANSINKAKEINANIIIKGIVGQNFNNKIQNVIELNQVDYTIIKSLSQKIMNEVITQIMV